MVDAQGFEPRLALLQSGVLPLNDTSLFCFSFIVLTFCPKAILDLWVRKYFQDDEDRE